MQPADGRHDDPVRRHGKPGRQLTATIKVPQINDVRKHFYFPQIDPARRQILLATTRIRDKTMSQAKHPPTSLTICFELIKPVAPYPPQVHRFAKPPRGAAVKQVTELTRHNDMGTQPAQRS